MIHIFISLLTSVFLQILSFYSNNGISDTANVLSEFLRDRDLRRVIVHNVPLVNNDSDVEESATDGTRRNTSGQRDGPLRIETVSRIRRRPIDSSTAEINQCMFILDSKFHEREDKIWEE